MAPLDGVFYERARSLEENTYRRENKLRSYKRRGTQGGSRTIYVFISRPIGRILLYPSARIHLLIYYPLKLGPRYLGIPFLRKKFRSHRNTWNDGNDRDRTGVSSRKRLMNVHIVRSDEKNESKRVIYRGVNRSESAVEMESRRSDIGARTKANSERRRMRAYGGGIPREH